METPFGDIVWRLVITREFDQSSIIVEAHVWINSVLDWKGIFENLRPEVWLYYQRRTFLVVD